MKVECINANHNENDHGWLESENNFCMENSSKFSDNDENVHRNKTPPKIKHGCFSFKVAHDKQKGR